MRALGVVMFLIACNSEPFHPPEPPPKPPEPAPARAADPNVVPDLTKSCPAFAEAQCAHYEHCQPAWAKLKFSDHAACVDRELGNCKAAWAVPGSQASDEWVARCADAVSHDTACTYTFGIDGEPACTPPPGPLADGATCIAHAQCAGAACIDKHSLIDVPCGTCARRARVGGRCPNYEQCVAGAHCIGGTCMAPRRFGEACHGGGECGAGLLCVDGKCQEIGIQGDGCKDDAGCRGGLACVGHRCAAPTPVGEGQPCTGDPWQPIGAHPCAGGLVCDSFVKPPKCVRPLKVGDACAASKYLCPTSAPCSTDGHCTVPTMAACAKH
jgi:hypothetical protein